jgi:peptidoglycan/xylan/chitin deacetylase (PgdA/CDA1 family)
MKLQWIKINKIIKKIFSNYIWDLPNNENKIYLTFDDGPIPEITEWTLNQLKNYNAKATFFCIGDNIQKHPELFQKIKANNHSVGNHTFNHLNGWETSNEIYLKNVELCSNELINKCSVLSAQYSEKDNCKLKTENCQLFRPPYGKIKPSQSKKLRKQGYKIIMWDVLSEDFDVTISKEKCLENVINNMQSGSIIVFHDSIKAFPNLEYTLPKVLEIGSKKGFVFDKII